MIDEGYREVSTWLAIYRWLRAVADVTEGLSLNESARVDLVSSNAHSASGLEDGTAFIAAVSRSGGTVAEPGLQALRIYEELRLSPNRSRVLESLAESRDLLRSVQTR